MHMYIFGYARVQGVQFCFAQDICLPRTIRMVAHGRNRRSMHICQVNLVTRPRTPFKFVTLPLRQLIQSYHRPGSWNTDILRTACAYVYRTFINSSPTSLRNVDFFGGGECTQGQGFFYGIRGSARGTKRGRGATSRWPQKPAEEPVLRQRRASSPGSLRKSLCRSKGSRTWVNAPSSPI